MTRAAERLGIQQPPLGQQIRQLEQQLGVTLFDRRPRQIALSETGRFFLSEAREVLARAAEAQRQVRRFDEGESGMLTVGMTSSASLHPVVPTILSRFHDRYPHATVEVQESETFELVTGLRDGSVDAALFHVGVERFPDLDACVLARVELIAAVPRSHPLAQLGGPITFDALAAEPMVIYRRREGIGIFDTLAQVWAARGRELRIASEVTRLIAAINLIAAGRGIALVPAPMVGLHAEAVTYLPLATDVLPDLPLSLAFRRGRSVRLVKNFILAATSS